MSSDTPTTSVGVTVHVPTPEGPAGVDMSFAALLARAKKHPQMRQAESALRMQRVFRVLNYGPRGGGKTTAITACAAHMGACAVIDLDKDFKPVPNVVHWDMPCPVMFAEIPALQAAFNGAIHSIMATFGKPDEVRITLLDTVTTLYRWIETFAVEADNSMGLQQSQVEYMQGKGKVARVCSSWCHAVWRMQERLAQRSNWDGPMMLAVTEHARPASKGETHPRFGPDGKAIVDLAFSQWVPVIGRATGAALEGECDLILAYSVDRAPDLGHSHLCETDGSHTKGRFTPVEWGIFRDHMKGTTIDRLATALKAIVDRRKQIWLQVWGSSK
jgi:hypothetical protein